MSGCRGTLTSLSNRLFSFWGSDRPSVLATFYGVACILKFEGHDLKLMVVLFDLQICLNSVFLVSVSCHSQSTKKSIPAYLIWSFQTDFLSLLQCAITLIHSMITLLSFCIAISLLRAMQCDERKLMWLHFDCTKSLMKWVRNKVDLKATALLSLWHQQVSKTPSAQTLWRNSP